MSWARVRRRTSLVVRYKLSSSSNCAWLSGASSRGFIIGTSCRQYIPKLFTCLYLGILAAELIGITSWFQAPPLKDDPHWPVYLFAHSREIWRLGLWVMGVAFF